MMTLHYTTCNDLDSVWKASFLVTAVRFLLKDGIALRLDEALYYP
jgi:hypothetical protein